MRQRHGDHVGDTFERVTQLPDALVVGAVGSTDDERLLVQPERVAAFQRAGAVNAGQDGNAKGEQCLCQRLLLAAPECLAHPADDGALARDERGVEDKGRIKVGRLRVLHHGRWRDATLQMRPGDPDEYLRRMNRVHAAFVRTESSVPAIVEITLA